MKAILEVLGESSVRAIIIAFATECVLRGMRVKSPGIMLLRARRARSQEGYFLDIWPSSKNFRFCGL